jgi:DNA helicase-2/ATP-dependent DNA helicase PcrA
LISRQNSLKETCLLFKDNGSNHILNRESELKYLEDVLKEVEEALTAAGASLDRGNEEVAKLKQYIYDDYQDMDVNELRENVEDAGNMELFLKNIRAKIKSLIYMKESPYFGKVCFKQESEEKARDIYIGTSGFWSDKDCTMKIFDWRAPVSSIYYDYELGDVSYKVTENDGRTKKVTEYKGEVTEKCQYKIQNGKMEFMSDTSERVYDELLLEALSGNAADHMHPVIATIQKKQNEIIRDDESEILVVDGRAGSGKTVIAMHRLAWLLYNKRKTLNTGNVMIISPNNIFSDYISQIMPELMEDSVPEKQWDDLTEELVFLDAEHETRAEQSDAMMTAEADSLRLRNVALKGSVVFFDAFEKYLDEFISNITFKDFHYEKLTYPADRLEKMFFTNLQSLPPYERFYNIAYFILDEYMEVYNRSYGEERQEKVQKQIQNQMIDRFAEKNIIKIYQDFLAVMSEKYPGVEQYLTEDGRICYEDLQIIFYLQLKLYGCNTYKDIKHCVIDEMQDYNVFQFKIMDMLIGGRKTILGDRFQILLSHKSEDSELCSYEDENVLDAIIRIWPERTLKVLNQTYRSTVEISDFCSKILGEAGEAMAFARHGRVPGVKVLGSEEAQLEAVESVLSELSDRNYHSIAILCDDEGMAYYVSKSLGGKARFLTESNSLFAGGTAVMSRFLAKGMEFDAVIVVTEANPEEENVARIDAGAYYISCTRALHELYVIGRRSM